MDGWNASAGSVRRESKGTRQIAQGRFLFLWTLQSETPFSSEMIKNGLGHEVRDEGENQRDGGTVRAETATKCHFWPGGASVLHNQCWYVSFRCRLPVIVHENKEDERPRCLFGVGVIPGECEGQRFTSTRIQSRHVSDCFLVH